MRLTLRNLLAYLDDTLEPAQAKLIGQKVAESDTAKELMARIRQVTRKRRLNPPPGGALDPNDIAAYLDNELTPERIAELEQQCLSSEALLAEVASCHQILTLVLGQPMLIPPTSRQRMYSLAKGKEAQPHRKPPAAQVKAGETQDQSDEDDETLRLGLPALRRASGANTSWVLLGSGLAVAGLLALALYMVLRNPTKSRESDYVAATQSAPNETARKPVTAPRPRTETSQTAQPPQATQPMPPATATDKQTLMASTDKEPVGTKKSEPAPMVTKPTLPDLPLEPPSRLQRAVGTLAPGMPPGVLLQLSPPPEVWQRIDAAKPEVFSGRTLLSLPGQRCEVQMQSGVRLTLEGLLREQATLLPLNESMVTLLAHEQLDLDLALHRGRIAVRNPRPKPARVRLRFDDPTNPERGQIWDITLESKDSEFLVDRSGLFLRDEPFYRDPKHPARLGPTALLHLLVRKGNVGVRIDDEHYPLQESPGPCLLPWSSVKGLSGRVTLPELPEWAKEDPAPPAGADKALFERYRGARDHIAAQLGKPGSKVDVGLVSLLKSNDAFERMLTLRCLAAANDLAALTDALGDEKRADVRINAIESLRTWIAQSRDNDYVLLAELRLKYERVEAEIILSLLHSFSEADARKVETYEALADYLDNTKIALRELGYYHLRLLAPQTLTLKYHPEMDATQRKGVQKALQAMISKGQLPPPAPKISQ